MYCGKTFTPPLRHHTASQGITQHQTLHTVSQGFTQYHKAWNSVTRPHIASHSIIRHHKASQGLTQHHKASQGFTQHHNSSHSITRPHRASQGFTQHHKASHGNRLWTVWALRAVYVRGPNKDLAVTPKLRDFYTLPAANAIRKFFPVQWQTLRTNPWYCNGNKDSSFLCQYFHGTYWKNNSKQNRL